MVATREPPAGIAAILLLLVAVSCAWWKPGKRKNKFSKTRLGHITHQSFRDFFFPPYSFPCKCPHVSNPRTSDHFIAEAPTNESITCNSLLICVLMTYSFECLVYKSQIYLLMYPTGFFCTIKSPKHNINIKNSVHLHRNRVWTKWFFFHFTTTKQIDQFISVYTCLSTVLNSNILVLSNKYLKFGI